MNNFCLPLDYIARSETQLSNDPSPDNDLNRQNEVYEAANYFCRAARRSTFIGIGCDAQGLLSVRAGKKIGIDGRKAIEICSAELPAEATWIEADLSKYDCISLSQLADNRAVVVCADLIQRLPDPTCLLILLGECYRRGAIVITSTTDRVRSHGQGHRGPPPNASHVREWTLEEYAALLGRYGIPPLFSGYTLNNNHRQELNTIVTLHDRTVVDRGIPHRRPLAIMSAFNEEDVIAEVMDDLVHQGCDVVAIDNWSTDATWQIMKSCQEKHPGNVTLERFPADGGSNLYEWEKILRRKEEIAAAHAGRWIIHTDADEVRRSPFPGMTLSQALKLAEESGANRVAFNLVDFRPVTDAPYRSGTLAEAFTHFEFGSKPAHYWQIKGWLQGSERVDLAGSGGHAAKFDGAKDYPYRFLLRHYPIRSVAQGRKKVIEDRQKRWSPQERDRGWHKHYDGFGPASMFQWNPNELLRFDQDFWRDYGLPIMTDIAERRQLRKEP